MSTIKKILMGFGAAVVLAIGGFLASEHLADSGPGGSTNPENIAADYRSLLAEAEGLKASAGSDCANKKSINQQIDSLQKKLDELSARKKKWLDNVPPLPEIDPDTIIIEDQLDRPGSEVPELPDNYPNTDSRPGSEVPELLDNYPNNDPRPGSEVPELLDYYPNNDPRPGSEVPELLDYYPNTDPRPGSEVPELLDYYPNTDPRPGSEIPELTSDAPPLPEIDDMDIINPDEYIFQMEDSEQKIKKYLEELKALCREDEQDKKKIVSDKCSDACQRYKDCASYGDDATPADLNDAYATCMEECATWPVKMVKCINAVDIKNPNDCVGFLNCQLPQHYEEKYLK